MRPVLSSFLGRGIIISASRFALAGICLARLESRASLLAASVSPDVIARSMFLNFERPVVPKLNAIDLSTFLVDALS